MKKYGHTGTLFFENGKYRWSYKYEHCINCGNTNYKHKGNGLCTSCFDKERAKTKARKEARRKAVRKRYNTREKSRTKNKVRLFKWKILNLISNKKEIKRKAMKKYCEKNKKIIYLKNKVNRLIKRGFPCMQMIVNGKVRYLPFETLEKPKITTDPKYEERKRNMKDFEILKRFYYKAYK